MLCWNQATYHEPNSLLKPRKIIEDQSHLSLYSDPPFIRCTATNHIKLYINEFLFMPICQPSNIVFNPISLIPNKWTVNDNLKGFFFPFRISLCKYDFWCRQQIYVHKWCCLCSRTWINQTYLVEKSTSMKWKISFCGKHNTRAWNVLCIAAFSDQTYKWLN